MSRKGSSSLVLDGSEVKFRLMAERTYSKSPVHVDWVRFTALLRNAPAVDVNLLFPVPDQNANIWESDYRQAELQRLLKESPDADFAASAQAHELAGAVCDALGPDFSVSAQVKKGQDFYRFRWCIERNSAECGWVGFLASGDSPRQSAQSQTLHCNLTGSACTFAVPGWPDRIADIVDALDAKLTRCDLALDFFDGFEGGIQGVFDAYKNGACDVGGRRLRSNCVGDWANEKERSFYFGSKEAGKQTNVYEKGHQLFGFESGSNWLRAELRYGNKLRVLPSDMLRRPADFFAGASDWHTAMLRLADVVAAPATVKCDGRLPLETVEAECYRNIKWALKTAAPTMSALFQNFGVDEFLEFVSNHKLPGRLQKFSASELKRAFGAAFGRFSQPESSPAFVPA